HSHFEMARHLSLSQLIERGGQHDKGSHQRQTEPGGLVIRRCDGEIQECAGLVPHTAVIGSAHVESVVARRKIGIERLPPSAGVLPIAVVAFQLVTKTYLLWRGEAERRVVDFQIAYQRRQLHLPIRSGSYIVVLAVSRDLFDVYRRRNAVEGKVARID